MATFPVQIEHGNHKINAQVPALPRPGDLITCEFPKDGIPMLYLVVKRVSFHESAGGSGNMWISVTTDGDPDQQAHNDEVFKRLFSGKA